MVFGGLGLKKIKIITLSAMRMNLVLKHMLRIGSVNKYIFIKFTSGVFFLI